MKRRLIVIFALLMGAVAGAQEFTAEYLDTVKVKKVKTINDYMTIGVNYGVTLSQMYFNPSSDQEWLFNPGYVSVMFTKYCKMFGYMPYFGIEAGFSYGHQGFRMLQDPDSKYANVIQFGTLGNVTNILEEIMTVIKVPVRAKFHADIYPFRIQAAVGIYAGYRTSVNRLAYGDPADASILVNFQSYENCFDYGMEGGLGFAFLFDPVEIHFNALMGWSWNSIYEPDSRPTATSKYYYRYAYPLDLMISAGVHFQLTKRSGKTNSQLRKEARDEVFKDIEKAKEAASDTAGISDNIESEKKTVENGKDQGTDR